jgi:internalin A
LDLRENKIKELPKEVLESDLKIKWGYDLSNSGICLEKNPLNIPPETIQKGKKAISNYFKLIDKKNSAPLNEAKVLILGQGGVGKTSLVNRLLHGIYDDKQNKTEGINVNKWYINIDNENIRLNVWDFGGQEIMHATHQFFLTKRSLYILLLDARQGEKDSRLEYWLKIIQTYGGDSPILLAINKTDQHQIQLNEKFLLKKYPNIKGFYNISCKTENGLDALKTEIEAQINELPHVHDILPKTWFDLKQQLENMRRDFISFNDYLKTCKKHNITESKLQHILIKLLHDLGIVLNFRDDEKRPQLRNVNILKPSWATDAIYKLINCNILFKNKGVLEIKQLNNLLDNKRYPEDKHHVLLELMEKFELCFKMPDMAQESYLIADLLDPQEPDTDWDYDNCLQFEYHYDVLPSSVFSRFLVRVHEYISQKTYWLTGVMLVHENNKALIKADIEDKKIMIWVNGTTETRRVLLGIIRGHFKVIHNSFAKLIIKELVPYKETHISYNRLLKLEQKKIKTEYLDEIDEKINVQEILNGLIEPENRDQERKEKRMIDDRSVHFHGDVKNLNIASGDNPKQDMTVNEADKSKDNDKPQKEWAGNIKLGLQILVALAITASAIAAWLL